MKQLFIRISVAALGFAFLATGAFGSVKPARIFSSGMVLQKGLENPVWGWADKGEKITVSFAGKTITTKADKNGKWAAKLPALDYGGPYEMILKSKKNTVKFTNVLIGEVWVCSGQSNMEWRVDNVINAKAEIKAANYPNIRLFTVAKKVAQTPVADLDEGEWVTCSPENIPAFSAVAYFFGRDLYQQLNVPVGLIHTSWGGTVAETWMSAQSIENDPDFRDRLKELLGFNMAQYKEQKLDAIRTRLGDFPEHDQGLVNGVAVYADPGLDDSDWKEISGAKTWEESGFESVDGIGWYRKTIELTPQQAKAIGEISLGTIDDNEMTWINGTKIGETSQYNKVRVYAIPPQVLKPGRNVIAIRVEDTGGGGGLYGSASDKFFSMGDNKIDLSDRWKFKVAQLKLGSLDLGPNDYPTLLFNGMINPILPYGIKGAIWYQGESNADRAKQYQRVFPEMITDWRNHWKEGDFPFLFVSLANYMAPDAQPQESAWAELREAQTKTLSLPNTGMALAIDIGEASDIHPRNKQDVGKRLCLAALKKAYQRNLVYSGPMYQSIKFEGNKAIVTFAETGSGLIAKNKYGYVNSFAIAGADRNYVWAKARITGKNTVEVTSEQVHNPIAVRFGWGNNPDDLNLYNAEGLPANPFRTDDWPGVTR